MNKNIIKNKLIKKYVENLQKFGYPEVNSENILTDYVYSNFFKSILEDSLNSNISEEIKEAITDLLNEIN